MVGCYFQGGVVMNWLIHQVLDSWLSYKAFNSSSKDSVEDSEATDSMLHNNSSSDETSLTNTGRSAITSSSDSLLNRVQEELGGGSGGGGGTVSWVIDSMTAEIMGSMGSNIGVVVQEDTGSRKGVVVGDWSFDATIWWVEGEQADPYPRWVIFNTVEEVPVHLVSKFVDIQSDILAVGYFHLARSVMVAF